MKKIIPKSKNQKIKYEKNNILGVIFRTFVLIFIVACWNPTFWPMYPNNNKDEDNSPKNHNKILHIKPYFKNSDNEKTKAKIK